MLLKTNLTRSPQSNHYFNHFFWFFWTGSLSFISLLFTRNLLFSGEAFLFFALEALFCALCFYLLQARFPPVFFKTAFCLLSYLFLTHIVSLLLRVLMDTDLNFLKTMLFQDKLNNFLVKMRALNISNTYFLTISLFLLSFPWLFYFIYFSLQKLSVKKQPPFTLKTVFTAFSIVFILFASFDLGIYKCSSEPSHKKLILSSIFNSFKIASFSKSAYFKNFSKIHSRIFRHKLSTDSNFPTFINSLPQNSLSNQSVSPDPKKLTQNIKCQKKPPIFLFVIESFRQDAINKKAAPFLKNFKKNNFSCQHSYANANCTHMAWFSIFFSKLPWNWTNPKEQGALALKLMKELGYKIEVFSSAELAYFNMKKKIFGKNLELTNVLEEITQDPSFQRDAAIFKTLNQKKFQDGTLYIIFLDTPHNEYSHPSKNNKFSPTISSLNYLKMALLPNQQAKLLKNRYLNCINYLDELFQNFFTNLKNSGTYDRSLIVISGDHGEEFYEHKAFFHGSHLSDVQLQIPLIYKIPFISHNLAKKLPSQTSQIDIFPTILHFLTGKHFDCLEGRSIFLKAGNFKTKDIIISFNQNGGADPIDFVLQEQIESITPPPKERGLSHEAQQKLVD